MLLIGTTSLAVRSLHDEEEVRCMALNLYHESRSESRLSRFAVGQVVFNRVESPKFPDTVCGVVKQGKHEGGLPLRNRCQFSWYCDGRDDDPRDRLAFREAMMLSRFLMATKGYLPDLTEGATHYHADYVMPRWAFKYKRLFKLDRHIFYK